jgi:hypothetical protein
MTSRRLGVTNEGKMGIGGGKKESEKEERARKGLNESASKDGRT